MLPLMRAGDKQVVGWTVERVRNWAGNGEKRRRDPVESEHGDKDTRVPSGPHLLSS